MITCMSVVSTYQIHVGYETPGHRWVAHGGGLVQLLDQPGKLELESGEARVAPTLYAVVYMTVLHCRCTAVYSYAFNILMFFYLV